MRWFLAMMMCFYPQLVFAQTGSLFASARGELVQARAALSDTGGSASLFSGHAQGGLFAPQAMTEAVQRLRHVIGQAESPRAGYDAVQHGARVKPAKRPTQMTLAEIYAWIDATPGQPHAIGRYQFIPETLARVATQAGAHPRERFSPALQDRLADVLLEEAGFPAFLDGRLNQRDFMDNLAAIWAGLPSSNGMSRYHGIAGNKATVSLAYFQSEIAQIAPG